MENDGKVGVVKYRIRLMYDGVESVEDGCTEPQIDTHTISFLRSNGKRVTSNLKWVIVEQ